MKYVHRFRVSAPLEAVADFHRHASSMAAITPPPVIVQMHHAPDHLQEGDEMEFSLWLAFLPIRWRARIENVSATGFVDRQLQGPFGAWRHRHTFVPISETETEVLDEVEAEPGPGLVGKVMSMGMWINMPLLFAYRGWRTRQILHRRQRWQNEGA